MTTDPLSDVVWRQYEKWIYPEPVMDLPEWLHNGWQAFDPSHDHRMLWPDRDYQPGMDILVAGCGTNQAAVIAYTNPSARVVAIDVSEASLRHHAYLAEKYDLTNLALHRIPIEQVDSLDLDFDLIICTGVIMLLADPVAGMRTLAERLRPDAVLAVMVYATYGRVGVQMMQAAFRDIGLAQDDEAIAVVQDALERLPNDHPVNSYLQMAPDTQDPAGLVDTFLQGRERDYTIDECHALVTASGLVFQDLFFKAPYYAPLGTGSALLASVASLPREQQGSIMERLNSHNACHYFMACRPDRLRESYVIDFDAGDWLRFIPSRRKGCHVDGQVVSNVGGSLALTPTEIELVVHVDGVRTIEDIVSRALRSGPVSRVPRDAALAQAQILFQRLWQFDAMAMALMPR